MTPREGYIEYTDQNIQIEIGKALASGKPFEELTLASRLENPLEKMLEEEDKGKPFSVKIGMMHNVKVVLLNTVPAGEVQLRYKDEVVTRFDTAEDEVVVKCSPASPAFKFRDQKEKGIDN